MEEGSTAIDVRRSISHAHFFFVVVVSVLASFFTISLIVDNFSDELNLSPFALGGGGAVQVGGQGSIGRAPTTVPHVPQNVDATDGTEQILVSWNAAPLADTYKIYRSNDPIVDLTDDLVGIVSSTKLWWKDPEAFVSDVFYYGVVAENAAGQSGMSIPNRGSVSATRGLRWSYPAPGNSWISDIVTFGNNGGNVFTEYGVYDNKRVLFSANDVSPPTPLWTDTIFEFNFNRKVDSASHADVYVAMHQEYQMQGSQVREAILRTFTSSSSSGPDWTYTFPIDIWGHSWSDVRVSDDGTKIVAAVLDGNPRVWIFNLSSSIPQNDFLVNSINGWLTFDISGDGSIAVFSKSAGIVKIAVVDLATGQEIDEITIFGSPNYGGVAVSENGDYILYGTKEKVLVYSRVGNNYVLEGTYPLATNEYAIGGSISANGDVFGVGIGFLGDSSYARIKKVDRVSLSTLVDWSPQSSGNYQNFARYMDFSDDGDVMAVGLWGDEAELSPEIVAFTGSGNVPSFEFQLTGSPLQIDISPDGTQLAVGSKGVHAGVAGGGGAHLLFDLV